MEEARTQWRMAGCDLYIVYRQIFSFKGLVSSLEDIKSYLEKVVNQQLPINHQIIYQLQDVFNLLPDINLTPFVKAVYVKTNDQMLVVYLASLIRFGRCRLPLLQCYTLTWPNVPVDFQHQTFFLSICLLF